MGPGIQFIGERKYLEKMAEKEEVDNFVLVSYRGILNTELLQLMWQSILYALENNILYVLSTTGRGGSCACNCYLTIAIVYQGSTNSLAGSYFLQNCNLMSV